MSIQLLGHSINLNIKFGLIIMQSIIQPVNWFETFLTESLHYNVETVCERVMTDTIEMHYG